MVEALTESASAFAQDRTAWVARSETAPGCRRLDSMRVVVLRHFATDTAARDLLSAKGLSWPRLTGDVTRTPSPHLVAVRRNPGDVVILSDTSQTIDAIREELSPTHQGHSFALDVSDGMVVVALEGADLDRWLAGLVDVLSIPAYAGGSSRARLADIAVLIVRIAEDLVWLVAERPLSPYIANWLAYAHEGAFGTRR